MTITSAGYDGNMTEAEWAKLSPLHGQPCVVNNALNYTGNVTGSDRTIRLSAGAFYGWGVRADSDTTIDVDFDPVDSGTRYDTVVARFNWGSNTTTVVKEEGGTAATIAEGLNNTPGTLADWPIYLVRLSSASTTPVSVTDLREFHAYDGVRRFPNATARDVHFPAPTLGSRVNLDSGGPMEYGVNGSGALGWKSITDSGFVAFTSASYLTAESEPVVIRREGSRVTLQGRLRRVNNAGLTSGTILGILPVGYRPTASFHGPVTIAPGGSSVTGQISIGTGGTVTLYTTVAAPWVSICGVSFYAA